MKPKQYTNKTGSLIVEAMQVGVDNIGEISNWANGAQIIEEKNALSGDPTDGLNIKTPGGMKRASHGDFVIKYGEMFAVTGPKMFLSKYTPVVPVDRTIPPSKVIERPPVVKDPWKDMTRMNEGPKP